MWGYISMVPERKGDIEQTTGVMENQFGCHEEAEEKDDDSLIDKCWTAKYKGDSRKWLIRDASYKKPRGPLVTSMKAAFPIPENNQDKWEHLGKRKSILLQKFYDEASEEVMKDRLAPPHVEDYCTEYDGNYKIPGFQVEEDPYKDQELYEKYPLYGTMPTTIYSHNIQNQYPKQYLEGHTKSTDRKSPFKRSCGFTTPLSERLDDRGC